MHLPDMCGGLLEFFKAQVAGWTSPGVSSEEDGCFDDRSGAMVRWTRLVSIQFLWRISAPLAISNTSSISSIAAPEMFFVAKNASLLGRQINIRNFPFFTPLFSHPTTQPTRNKWSSTPQTNCGPCVCVIESRVAKPFTERTLGNVQYNVKSKRDYEAARRAVDYCTGPSTISITIFIDYSTTCTCKYIVILYLMNCLHDMH